ncbi:hypothetical protein Anas_07096 [Armadillidium nasatum]|uniref:BZIP domain-containing protein n=1 Tax=Armadillidium nasatum TaxID=96803 RepID=A0A5N5SNY9_9CRUS|nr:hypothetical protein Anas_07096 [Armadillidium nasatum]
MGKKSKIFGDYDTRSQSQLSFTEEYYHPSDQNVEHDNQRQEGEERSKDSEFYGAASGSSENIDSSFSYGEECIAGPSGARKRTRGTKKTREKKNEEARQARQRRKEDQQKFYEYHEYLSRKNQELKAEQERLKKEEKGVRRKIL